jgi:Esterase/lipase
VKYQVPETWYNSVYRDEAAVIPGARSFSILSEGAKHAVLLIHGYAGYPGELVRPARDLASLGYDCYVPRLPGMGTSGKDFLASSFEDGEKVLFRALTDLAERYETVSVVAHSMGTLYATLLSETGMVDRVVLAGPAFRIKGAAALPLKAMLKVTSDMSKDWKPDPRYVMYYDGAPASDELLGKEYWSHIYPAKLLELLDLARKAGKAAANMKAECLMLLAGNDALVENEAAEKLLKNAKCVALPDATHFMFYDIDKKSEEDAVSAVVSFLSR